MQNDQTTIDILKNICEKNEHFQDKELLLELSQLFLEKSEAVQFLHLYGTHCELIDDLVDEKTTPELVDKLGQLRMDIDACPFWNKHKTYLFLVERLIHNTYFDSVKWEKSEDEWKRRDAKALSHVAYNMLFAVIIIEFGYETLEKYSIRFREHAHKRHINDPV